MTMLVWDEVGERKFESGVDRVVLYLPDGRSAPWNGVTSIEDTPTRESESHYLDGVKFLERQTPGDFSANLKAWTYPDIFDEVNGVEEVFEGLFYHDQAPGFFNLAYRTRLGNDVEGADLGYRIHLLYNVVAIPSSFSHQTLGEIPTLAEFSWALKGVPKLISGHRPTVHISIDSVKTDPERLTAVENLLYGTDLTNPSLPAIDTFTALFDTYNDLFIVDNGDGTWTAVDAGNQYITMLDAETFQIDDANTVVLDADTYTISDTEPD